MAGTLIDRLQKELAQRESTGLLRQLSTERLTDFISNDYLGLARSRTLHDLVTAKFRNSEGIINGATGSRLLSGNSTLAEQLEDELARIFHGDAALLFNSGYVANLGVLSSIPTRNDTILYDELAHASIKDGARLSLARRLSFRHNDLNDLEHKLKQAGGQCYVVVESVYSMDGDRCPLPELVALAERFDATIVLDEAHSTGVDGEGGAGIANALGIAEKIGIRIYTFGKAMGCHGACVVGSPVVKEYLINRSRPFIYTTALPPHALLTITCAFAFLEANPQLVRQLQTNIALFVQHLNGHHKDPSAATAIQSIQFPGNKNVNRASAELRARGFDVRAIRAPTVPAGTERIRICIHSFNEHSDIIQLAQAISGLKD